MSKNLSAKYYQESKESRYFYRRKRKKAAIWSWALSLKGWKTKACWVDKKMLENDKKYFTTF